MGRSGVLIAMFGSRPGQGTHPSPRALRGCPALPASQTPLPFQLFHIKLLRPIIKFEISTEFEYTERSEHVVERAPVRQATCLKRSERQHHLWAAAGTDSNARLLQNCFEVRLVLKCVSIARSTI